MCRQLRLMRLFIIGSPLFCPSKSKAMTGAKKKPRITGAFLIYLSTEG